MSWPSKPPAALALPPAQGAAFAAALASFATLTTHGAQMAAVDALLLKWAATSSMSTLGERVAAYNSAHPANPAAGTQTNTSYQGLQWVQSQALADEITVLEAFNGQYLYDLGDASSSTATATNSTTNPNNPTAPAGFVKVNIPGSTTEWRYEAQALSPQLQIFLDDSYQALRQSVFDNLAAQTRLKGYLDLASAANGVYDFTAVEMALATNDKHWRIAV